MRTRANLDDIHIDDIEWMAIHGENLQGIAARTGAKPRSIEQLVRREGRIDLLRKISANGIQPEMSRR